MSFEKENEARRVRELISENVIKQNGVNNISEVFYVGSPDLLDAYCGKPIYISPVSNGLDETSDLFDENEFFGDEEGFDSCSSSLAGDDEAIVNNGSMSEEDLNTANEIYRRLRAEAAADEMARQAEIEAIKRQVEKTDDMVIYSSGSPSANYGQKPMNAEDSEAFASIMNNNKSFSFSIENLVAGIQ